MVLSHRVVHRLLVRVLRNRKNRRDVKALGLPMFNRCFRVENFAVSDHLFNRTESKFGHNLTHFFSDELKEVDNELGLAVESFAQNWVLCRNTNRTSVEMAGAHHDATTHHEWRCREAKFFCTKQCCHNHIAPGLHLTIRLHNDAVAQTIQHERLLCFSQTKFPWSTGMLE